MNTVTRQGWLPRTRGGRFDSDHARMIFYTDDIRVWIDKEIEHLEEALARTDAENNELRITNMEGKIKPFNRIRAEAQLCALNEVRERLDMFLVDVNEMPSS